MRAKIKLGNRKNKRVNKAEKGEYSNPHDNDNSGSTLLKAATNHCKQDYS